MRSLPSPVHTAGVLGASAPGTSGEGNGGETMTGQPYWCRHERQYTTTCRTCNEEFRIAKQPRCGGTPGHPAWRTVMLDEHNAAANGYCLGCQDCRPEEGHICDPDHPCEPNDHICKNYVAKKKESGQTDPHPDGWSAPKVAIDAAWLAVEELNGHPTVHPNVIALAVSAAFMAVEDKAAVEKERDDLATALGNVIAACPPELRGRFEAALKGKGQMPVSKTSLMEVVERLRETDLIIDQFVERLLGDEALKAFGDSWFAGGSRKENLEAAISSARENRTDG